MGKYMNYRSEPSDRTVQMFNLHLGGKSYREIGATFGVSGQRVQQLLSPPLAIRQMVVTNASGLCQGCGIHVGPSGHIHHIGCSLELADSYQDISNLELLCPTCHRLAHTGPQIEQPVAVALRLPADLHAALVALAAREHRSINAQLVHLITEATKETTK